MYLEAHRALRHSLFRYFPSILHPFQHACCYVRVVAPGARCAAEASTVWVRYLYGCEEVEEGTILRSWSGADHPVMEGKRASPEGQLSGTTTATMGRSSTLGWHSTRGTWRVG